MAASYCPICEEDMNFTTCPKCKTRTISNEPHPDWEPAEAEEENEE